MIIYLFKTFPWGFGSHLSWHIKSAFHSHTLCSKGQWLQEPNLEATLIYHCENLERDGGREDDVCWDIRAVSGGCVGKKAEEGDNIARAQSQSQNSFPCFLFGVDFP